MRILHVVSMVSKNYSSGIISHVKNLIKYQKKDNTIFLLAFLKMEGNAEKLTNFEGVPVIYLNCQSGHDLKLIYRFWKVLRDKKVDIIHFHSLPFLGVIPVIFGSPTKKIFTVHLLTLTRKITFVWFNFIDGIIAVSGGVLQDARTKKKLFPKSAWKVIYNGVDTDIKSAAVVNTVSKSFNLITVARLSKDKHVDDIVRLIYVLKKDHSINISLQILGDGPERQTIEGVIDEYKLNNAVQLLGNINEIEEYLLNKDGFVILSDCEAFPIAPLEAAAYGVPVFSYRIPGGLHEWHRNNETGIVVNERSIELLAREVANLLRDEKKLAYLKTNVAKAVKSLSTFNTFEYTMSFYKEVMNK